MRTLLLLGLACFTLSMIGCGSGQPDMNTEEAKKAFDGEPMPPEAAQWLADKQKAASQGAQQQIQQGTSGN